MRVFSEERKIIIYTSSGLFSLLRQPYGQSFKILKSCNILTRALRTVSTLMCALALWQDVYRCAVLLLRLYDLARIYPLTEQNDVGCCTNPNPNPHFRRIESLFFLVEVVVH